MKRLLTGALALILSVAASATTLNPIQLLNPAGSASGQAIVSTGASTAPAWANVSAASLAAQAANTVVANVTGALASPTAFAMPSCSTSGSALNWTSGSGFTCNASVNAATLGGNAIGTSGATIPLLNGANTWSGAQTFSSTITPSQTSGIVGTTTNNNANAGSVGEFPTPTNLSSISVTNGTAFNASSVSLTAGDWDVSGCIYYSLASTTTASFMAASINTTSATLPANPGPNIAYLSLAFSAGPATDYICTPLVRESLSTTTTVFLVGSATFATSTMTANGFLFIRRIR